MEKYIVGQIYSVPCIFLEDFWFVLLHQHMGEISGREHQHIDLRFMSDAQISAKNWKRDEMYACRVQPVHNRDMLCHSEYVPIKHYDADRRRDFLTLQKSMSKNKMECRVCPHQGFDMSGIDPVKIGGKSALVCPCHGLTWSVETGEMIRRIPKVIKSVWIQEGNSVKNK